ncbi:MAG TPA: glycoside hydrolase family 2 TIM barrel-domain containing protein [Aggregatilineaceae bacterium]|nr:glycoside hydrolase family 2 TIM barrel-domain containing protein [Aggregatilineaceae bacterium]
MRTLIPFNDGWLYHPEPVDDTAPDSRFEPVTLPHANVVLPHHNFDNAEYQFVSTYRRRFTPPELEPGQRLFVDFEGAMIASTVALNGVRLGEYRGGFTPFSFDLTDQLVPGENLLTVHLDSRERTDIPPYGFVVDYLTFGGIYREVALRVVDACHIEDVFVQTRDVLTGQPRVAADTTLRNLTNAPRALTLRAELLDAQGQRLADATEAIALAPGEALYTLEMQASGVRRWTLDNPALYTLRVTLAERGALTDCVDTRFGFREARFEPDGFYLNGERLPLIGLNRHQTYPYIGAAAPARLQRRDAEIVKWELGCNLVRTSHYPQSRHFLDRCDEIGLLVFEEIPGWQHIGDDDWKQLSLDYLRAMIVRDRSRPAIILWGVRVNESPDDEAFYTATNALARRLDPTRQTGGVRYFQDSQFLEDVFTYNDFSNTVVEPKHTPHMVTEFNGHMFPTKSWDQEERAVEHALRHARIQDRQIGMPDVVGAIGWCAFDYNTHQEFGSGDRVCYHGVMDIFRLPKYAAYFYGSQIDPARRVVLQAATVWSMGDRSGGGVNPLVVFSNCDAIEVFIGDERIGRFSPDRETFPHLPHAPYVIPMPQQHLTWGRTLPDLRLMGHLNGEAVAEQRIAADGLPRALALAADHGELIADGADMTRVAFRIVDRFGNRLPYTNQVVTLEVEGPADLIGENPFALAGGQAAVYLRARREPGEVRIRATTPRLPPAEVTIRLRGI